MSHMLEGVVRLRRSSASGVGSTTAEAPPPAGLGVWRRAHGVRASFVDGLKRGTCSVAQRGVVAKKTDVTGGLVRSRNISHAKSACFAPKMGCNFA